MKKCVFICLSLVLLSCDSFKICENSTDGAKKVRIWKDFTPRSMILNERFLKLDNNKDSLIYGIQKIKWNALSCEIEYMLECKNIHLDSIKIHRYGQNEWVQYDIVNRKKSLFSFKLMDIDTLLKDKLHGNIRLDIIQNGNTVHKIYIYSFETERKNKAIDIYFKRIRKYPWLFRRKCVYDYPG